MTRDGRNKERRLVEPAPDQTYREALAGRAEYGASPKHKHGPYKFGLSPYTGAKEDSTFCDAHADFRPTDMDRIPGLLLRGISAGLIGKGDAKGDPPLLWTVDDNGWIYEARITNPGQALYHAYPVLLNEAIARKVIERYSLWVAECAPYLVDSLGSCRGRYK